MGSDVQIWCLLSLVCFLCVWICWMFWMSYASVEVVEHAHMRYLVYLWSRRIKQFPLLLSGQRALIWVGLMCTCTSVVQLQSNGGNHLILKCCINILSESLNQLAWCICAAASANWWTDAGPDQKQGLSYTFTRQRKIHASFAIRPIGVSIRRCTRLDKCDVEGFKRDLSRFEDCK